MTDDCVYLTHAADAYHLRRWATMHVQVDLFGGVDLVCRSGRLGLGHGRERRRRFATVDLARVALQRMVRDRLRRGYHLARSVDRAA